VPYLPQQPPPQHIPQQRAAGAPADEPDRTPDQGTGEEPGGPGRSGPSTLLIAGAVLIGATVLVVGALGVTFLLQQLRGSAESTTYQVGECVVQSGDAAQRADCTDPGAYEIVAQVDNDDDCDDPTQPTIEVAGPPAQFYCLAPAVSGGEPEATEDESGGDG
jgi:hypothetical protein